MYVYIPNRNHKRAQSVLIGILHVSYDILQYMLFLGIHYIIDVVKQLTPGGLWKSPITIGHVTYSGVLITMTGRFLADSFTTFPRNSILLRACKLKGSES